MTVDPVPSDGSPVERVVEKSHLQLERQILRRDGSVATSRVRRGDFLGVDLGEHAAYDAAWLRGGEVEHDTAVTTRSISMADMFSGCGGLTVGASEAARALGLHVDHVLALDTNSDAMAVYQDNFDVQEARTDFIENLVDRAPGEPLSILERALRKRMGGIDLALGGPPCQGHSDLNNHTRRDDPKNHLYLSMSRFIEVVRPTHALIENVPGVRHSRRDVVSETVSHLEALGYVVSTGVVHAAALGAAQNRRRHLLIATLADHDLDVADLMVRHGRTPRPVTWAIEDLDANGATAFDSSAEHAPVNKKRIQYLFDNDLYELPNSERPDCHRLKPHRYGSVYGRMHPDVPSPTLTSGFGSTGQGRFVHPTQPRTLTPHEAARLQGFPDSFSFGAVPLRTPLSRMIGNAVPSRLAYVAALEMLR